MLSNSRHTRTARSICSKLLLTTILLAFFFAPLSGLVPSANAEQGQTAATYGAASNVTSPASNATPPGSGINTWECDTSASIFIGCIVYVFTVGLATPIAYMGSFVLDVGIHLSLQSVAYSLNFLTSGWTAVRDIANIAFIFILIYIAITIILQAEQANTMKMLAGVVVMALLINFSFFLTRAVIDAGNILAIQFYNAVPGTATIASSAQASGVNVGAVGANALGLNSDSKDLTSNFMQMIQVQNILGQGSFQDFVSNNQKNMTGTGAFLTNLITQIVVFIGVAVILAFLAVAFFTVGIKFIVRMIVLWFVIIGAPLAFAAKALTGKGSVTKLFDEWLGTLVTFSFYPAIFLFIFLLINYVAIALAQGSTNGLVGAVFSDLNASPTSGVPGLYLIGAAIMNVAIRMGIIVAMLYFGTQLSDKLVTQGAGMAGTVTKWASSKTDGIANTMRRAPLLGAVPFTATARGINNLTYRPLVGSLGKNLKEGVAGSKFWNQESRFGWRSGVRKAVGSAGESMTHAKGLSKISYHEAHEQHEKDEKERKENLRKIDLKQDLKALAGFVTTEKAGGTLSAADEQERDRIVERVSKLSQGEIEANFKDIKDLKHISRYINEATMKKITDSKQYSDGDRESFDTEWNKTSKHAPRQQVADNQKLTNLNINTPEINQALRDLSTKGVVLDKESSKALSDAIRAGLRDLDDERRPLVRERQQLRQQLDALRASGAAAPAVAAAEQAHLAKLRELKSLDDRRDLLDEGSGFVKKAEEARGKSSAPVLIR